MFIGTPSNMNNLISIIFFTVLCFQKEIAGGVKSIQIYVSLTH